MNKTQSFRVGSPLDGVMIFLSTLFSSKIIAPLLKCFIVSCIICLSLSQVRAQVKYDQYYYSKRDIGINATTLMANIFNLNPDNAGSPYSMYFRYRMGKTFIRTGFNFGYTKSTEFDPNDISVLDITTQITQLRSGLEWGEHLGGNFMMFYGFDVFVGQEYEKSSRFLIQSEERSNFVGVGPALRFEYKLFKRLLLSTETSIYGMYAKNTHVITGIDDKKTNDFDLRINLPTALFIGFQF